VRRKLVPLAVTRQKNRFDAVDTPDQQWRGRLAVRRIQVQPLADFQARPLIHAGAADHCDFTQCRRAGGFAHGDAPENRGKKNECYESRTA
jgi:hypothetical protein